MSQYTTPPGVHSLTYIFFSFFQMVTDQDNDQNTPLHLAVENRSFEVAQLCIEKSTIYSVSCDARTFKIVDANSRKFVITNNLGYPPSGIKLVVVKVYPIF